MAAKHGTLVKCGDNRSYINSNDHSLKLLNLDYEVMKRCDCSRPIGAQEASLGVLCGWCNQLADDNAKKVKEKKAAAKHTKSAYSMTSSLYQHRLQPYIGYPAYDSTSVYEKLYRPSAKPFVFHHYASPHQYIEQYRMFHSSVPYHDHSSNSTGGNDYVDPPWDPTVYKVKTPSDFCKTEEEQTSKIPRTSPKKEQSSTREDQTSLTAVKFAGTASITGHAGAGHATGHGSATNSSTELKVAGEKCAGKQLTRHNIEQVHKVNEDVYIRQEKHQRDGATSAQSAREHVPSSDHVVDLTKEKPLTAPTADAQCTTLTYDQYEVIGGEGHIDAVLKDNVTCMTSRSVELSKELSRSTDSLRILPAITTGNGENLVVDSRKLSENSHHVELYYVSEKKQKLNNALAEIQEAERRKQKEIKLQRQQMTQSLEGLPVQRHVGTCELFCAGENFSLESQRLDATTLPKLSHSHGEGTWKAAPARKSKKYRPLGSLVSIVKNRHRILFH